MTTNLLTRLQGIDSQSFAVHLSLRRFYPQGTHVGKRTIPRVEMWLKSSVGVVVGVAVGVLVGVVIGIVVGVGDSVIVDVVIVAVVDVVATISYLPCQAPLSFRLALESELA